MNQGFTILNRQIQNAAIAQTQGQDKPQIFKGLEIYVSRARSCQDREPLYTSY
jgi:hypothetical protein